MQVEPDAVNLRVPFQPPSASLVRRELRTWLSQRGLTGESVEDARVVVSELVGNSVRHAAPLDRDTIVVSWCLEGPDLVISVSDGGGPNRPRPVQAQRGALSGRGLSIVAALADQWWVERSEDRTTVHVRLSVGTR